MARTLNKNLTLPSHDKRLAYWVPNVLDGMPDPEVLGVRYTI